MSGNLKYVKNFKELEVYQRQREVSQTVFRISKHFPHEEKFSLTDQFRRAARSIGSQVAEAWAKRLYPKHFVSKLTDADGEQLESQHWAIEARDCGYMTSDQCSDLISKCEEIGRMLGSMMRKADKFASHNYSLRDEEPPYLAIITKS